MPRVSGRVKAVPASKAFGSTGEWTAVVIDAPPKAGEAGHSDVEGDTLQRGSRLERLPKQGIRFGQFKNQIEGIPAFVWQLAPCQGAFK